MSKTKVEQKEDKYYYLANPYGLELYGKTNFKEDVEGYEQVTRFISHSSVPLEALKESEKGVTWDEDPDREGFIIWIPLLESPEEEDVD